MQWIGLKITIIFSRRMYDGLSANGMAFSDGIESDVIEFNAGSEIDIRIASRKGHLVV